EMQVEPLVFESLQRGQIIGGHVVHISGQPPAAFAVGEQAQKSAVSILDRGGKIAERRKVGWIPTVQPRQRSRRQYQPDAQRRRAQGEAGGTARQSHVPAQPAHGWTVIRPDACRAKKRGLYMSVTSPPGSSYRPGVTARTMKARRNFGLPSLRSTAATKRSSRPSMATGSDNSPSQSKPLIVSPVRRSVLNNHPASWPWMTSS